MGNIVSLSDGTIDFASLVDHKASTLSEDVAYAIATAWHRDIATYMWLGGEFPALAREGLPFWDGQRRPDRTPHSRFSLGEDIEFVDFTFSDINDQVLAHVVPAARAAVFAWFALSCCPGFSGTENPAFWWRVFMTIDTSSATPTPPWSDDEWSKLHLVENHPFFPHPDRPFPRIRVRSLGPKWRPIFLFGKHLPQAIKQQLKSVFRALNPFISSERWARELPVAYCVGFKESMEWLVDKKSIFQSKTNGDMESPKRMQKPMRIIEAHSINNVIDRVDRLVWKNIPVRYSDSTESRFVLGDNFIRTTPSLRLELLDLNGYRYQASPARYHDVTVRYMAKCCSALPHTEVIQGVKVGSYYSRRERITGIEDICAAWVGYAIFHPSAAVYSCSFANLKLDINPQHRSFVQILASMAKGNNLLDPMGCVSTIYRQVKLRCGTPVWSRPVVKANPTEKSENKPPSVLHTCTVEEWMTECFVDPDEARNEWTQVVLPGHGLGWVRATDVLETVDRLAGRSNVRRLFLSVISDEESNNPTHDDVRKQVVLDVLSVLGSELEFLKLGTGNWDLTATNMCDIFTKCPNLKSLSVQHDGSCWSSMNSVWIPDKPRLRELELVIGKIFEPLVAPQLNQLKVFRLTSVIRPTASFDTVYHTFFFLTRAISSTEETRVDGIRSRKDCQQPPKWADASPQ